jgi:hypothetical protein
MATVLTATVNAFAPLPLPLAGSVIVIHGTWLTAVHAQPAFVVTVTLLPPPAAGIDTDGGCSEMVQLGGAGLGGLGGVGFVGGGLVGGEPGGGELGAAA